MAGPLLLCVPLGASEEGVSPGPTEDPQSGAAVLTQDSRGFFRKATSWGGGVIWIPTFQVADCPNPFGQLGQGSGWSPWPYGHGTQKAHALRRKSNAHQQQM